MFSDGGDGGGLSRLYSVMAPFRHKVNRLFTQNTLLLFSDMPLHCGTLTKVKEPGLEVSMNNSEINKHNCHNSVNYSYNFKAGALAKLHV